MNRITLQGDWNVLKGRLKQKWAVLTDDDLQYVDGRCDELVGRIQRRTGEARDVIERFLESFDDWEVSPDRPPVWKRVGPSGVVGLLVIFVALSATGCKNTAEGFGKDVENAGEKIQEKVD